MRDNPTPAPRADAKPILRKKDCFAVCTNFFSFFQVIMFLTGAFLNLSINKPHIYERNVFFLFSSLPYPRSSTVSHLLVQLLPSAGQNLELIPNTGKHESSQRVISFV